MKPELTGNGRGGEFMMTVQTKTRNVQVRERLDISGFVFTDGLVPANFLLFESCTTYPHNRHLIN